MPGLCGFSITPESANKAAAVLARMQETLVYRKHHCNTPLFTDDHIASTGVHLEQVLKNQGPLIDNDVSVWIDGEFYSTDRVHAPQFAGILSEQYRCDRLLPFLKKVDGIFAAIIYDRRKQLLHIISDRYGLRHLYIAEQTGQIAWASELKAFRCIAGLRLELRDRAIDEFLGSGHFSGNRTWFDAVRLIDPGTIVSVNLHDGTSVVSTYWNFIEIEKREMGGNLDTLASEMGVLFTSAVQKRCGQNERTGIGLSGGLDSRAIFAAMPAYCNPVCAVTFGREQCHDARIAAQVAALRPSKHTIQTINEKNWFDNRFTGVWLTDGQISLQHMHGIEKIDDFRNYYDFELNGFLGDALLGGSYSSAPCGEIRQFLDRGRRFIATALTLGNLSYHTRLPFFDNALIELTLSIPAAYRKNSFIYNRMLLRMFPEFFTKIPWQKTGLPISKTGLFWDAVRMMRKVTNKVQLYIPVMKNNSDYVDYDAWIRKEPACSRFRELLLSPDTLLYHYLDKKNIQRDVNRHLSGRSNAELLCRYATMEIWMRQFFRNELLP